MPFTFNGIGTWYYGKQNIYREKGTCPFCNRFVEQSSYDTTLFFVVVYIPVIPLGKKRILHECPVCRKHHVLALEQWNNNKQTALADLTTRLKENPDDVELLKQVLLIMIQSQDRNGFLKAAERMHDRPIPDASFWLLMATGYEFALDKPQAESCLRHALVLNNQDTATQEQLARILMLQSKPDEAKPYLEHLFKLPNPQRTGLLALQITAWQQVGQHQTALEYLERVFTAYPALAKEKEYIKLRKTSLKHAKTGKAIASPYLAAPGTGAGNSSGYKTIWIGIGCLALLGLVGMMIFSWFKGESQTFYLINGLDRPYEVSVDDKKVTLQPHQMQTLQLPEGQHRMQITSDFAQLPPETFSISNSFLLRPFIENCYVLNPDQAAVIMRLETVYAADPNENEEPAYTAQAGSSFYDFGPIDYPFSQLPSSISLSSKSSQVVKTSLSELYNLDADTYAGAIRSKCRDKAFFKMLEQHVLLDKDNTLFVSLLYALQDPEKASAFLKKHLDEKPLRISLHRYYQELEKKKGKMEGLRVEYEEKLQQNPDDGILLYLTGRLQEGSKAIDYFNRATRAVPPCAYAFYALSYHELGKARYAEALTLAEKAASMEKENLVFQSSLLSSRLGLKKWDDLLEMNAAKRKKNPDSLALAGETIEILLRQGNTEQALQLEAAYKKRIKATLKPGEDKAVDDYFAAIHLYASGDLAAYAAKLRSVGGPQQLYYAVLCEGKAGEAMKMVDEKPGGEALNYFLVYLAAVKHGDKETEAKALEAALARLEKESDDKERLSAIFKNGSANHESALADLSFDVVEKAVYLTALGYARPEMKTYSHALARELNIGLSFPAAWLDTFLTAGVQQSGPPLVPQ